MEKVNQFLKGLGLIPLAKKNDEDITKRLIKDVEMLIGPRDEAKLKTDLVEYYFYEIGSLRLEDWEKQFSFTGLTVRQKEMLGEIFSTGLYYYDTVDDTIYCEVDFPTVESALKIIRKNLEAFFILFPGLELSLVFQSEGGNNRSVLEMLESKMNNVLKQTDINRQLKRLLYEEVYLVERGEAK